MIRWLGFPLLLLGGLALGAWLLGEGVRGELVVAGLSVSGALALLGLERLIPYRPEWNRSREDIGLDATHTFFSMALVPKLCEAATLTASYAAAAWLARTVGASLWPTGWPLLAQVALAMPITEFGSYWTHRLMHEVPLLWRLHAVHHSAPRLYWLNAGRFHPLDTILSYPAQVLPLVLLGAGPEVLALFSVFTSLHGMSQHANVDVRLGPLNRLFSMSELHRWHHARDVALANHNYGSNLSVWDTVFGTWFLPRGEAPPTAIGFEGDETYPQTYLGQLKAPFARAAP